ncbi:MAG: S16 family serine protease [archaeon]
MNLQWKQIWEIIAIIILAEITFFGGMAFQELRTDTEKETEYIIEEKIIREPYDYDEFIKIDGERSSINGIGINPDNETGKLINFTVVTRLGEGDILIKTNKNIYDDSFQSSTRDIKKAVKEETGRELSKIDITIKTTQTGSIKGSSGSLSLGIALKEIITGEELNSTEKAATGVLRSGGSIAPVSFLDEKIKVAEEEGINELIIPGSQCEEYEEREEIKISCANNLDEAFEIMKR